MLKFGILDRKESGRVSESKILRVSGSTSAKQLAGCIVTCLDNREQVSLRAVGASAVNQMYKAMAIANSIMASKGYTLKFRPGFDEFTEEGELKTAMIARLEVV